MRTEHKATVLCVIMKGIDSDLESGNIISDNKTQRYTAETAHNFLKEPEGVPLHE